MELCVILPARNEEANIVAVVSELVSVVNANDELGTVMLVVVDDASTDGGIALLRDWFRGQSSPKCRLTIISLLKRNGHSLAQLKGFKFADTLAPRLTVVMDADGQDDPAHISEMVRLSAGCDVVFATRGRRNEPLWFKFCYFCFQQLMFILSGSYVRQGQFCALRRRVLAHVAKLGRVDYLGVFLYATEFTIKSFVVHRRARMAGKSKYGFFRHLRTACIIISYRPVAMTRLFFISCVVIISAAVGVAVCGGNVVGVSLLCFLVLLLRVAGFNFLRIVSARADSVPFRLDEKIEEVTR